MQYEVYYYDSYEEAVILNTINVIIKSLSVTSFYRSVYNLILLYASCNFSSVKEYPISFTMSLYACRPECFPKNNTLEERPTISGVIISYVEACFNTPS